MSDTRPETSAVTQLLTEAIRQRLTRPTGRFFSVKAVEDGHVVTLVVVADSVGMPQTGHLIFAAQDPATKENRVVRIFTPSTWLGVRDVTADGPEAVAAFLKEMHGEGAGTA